MAANPPDPITPVIDRLTAIVQTAEAQGSRIGYFASLYRRVTVAVRDQIDGFDDPARLQRLDVLFASRYLDALAAWQAKQPCSSCWQVAFDATQSAQPIILQHLLLGINAHINLDLGVACARTSPGDQLPALHGDFLRINALLGGLVNTVAAELSQVSPFIGLIAQVLGDQGDDEIANFGLGAARDFAWHVAESLAPLPIALQAPKIAVLDKIVAAFGKHLARPDELLSAAYRIIRSAETASVAEVIEVLAAG
ncbi:MAG TPA: DUF5995 family protein [Thermoanaerobaculia bacterium]|nr:DUF5995 family protein [Thermoanaerobaculia bacterium]